MADLHQMYDDAINLKEQGDLDGAVAKLKEILALDDTYALAHTALAVYLQKLGDFEEAIRHAIRVTDLEPNDSLSFTQLSVIYQRCGMIPQAEQALYKAREMQASGH